MRKKILFFVIQREVELKNKHDDREDRQYGQEKFAFHSCFSLGKFSFFFKKKEKDREEEGGATKKK